MDIDVVTVLPEFIEAWRQIKLIQRGIERGVFTVRIHSLRHYTHDLHRTVDDYPYGGGAGMVMKPEPFFEAVEDLQKQFHPKGKVILLTPRGTPFTQSIASQLAEEPRLIFLCGRYEGVDERVHRYLTDEEISLGDFILMGGEIPALAVIESIIRLLPGLIEKDSIVEESFTAGYLEYPHFTRPQEYRGMKVPEILVSGNHEKVRLWRMKEALRLTHKKRPDLLMRRTLSPEEKKMMQEIMEEEESHERKTTGQLPTR